MVYNIETKSNYYYPPYENTNFLKKYLNLNLGTGLNYFISEKTAVFADAESYILGGYKGYSYLLIFKMNRHAENTLYNIGIKYSFQK